MKSRYLGVNAMKRQAGADLRWAGRVRDGYRTFLGVRPPHRRRKSP